MFIERSPAGILVEKALWTCAYVCVGTRVHVYVSVHMLVHTHTLKGWGLRSNKGRDHSMKDLDCHLNELGLCGKDSGAS